MKLRRTPLLVFDQFDDYQTRHLSQFRPGRRQTWLSVDKVIEVNSFWRDIKKLIDDEDVHCLFIMRADNAVGLESIRLTHPQIFTFDRLNVDTVQPLLTSLTTHAEGSKPIVIV